MKLTEEVSVPKLIKSLRETAGLTQRDLAKNSRLTNTAISMYENESMLPTLSSAIRIFNALGYDLTLVQR